MSTRRSKQGKGRAQEVRTPSDWEDVIAPLDGLHDAVVRELSLLGEEYLGKNYVLEMSTDPGATARVLVHIQRRDVPALILTFKNVQIAGFSAADAFDPARCEHADSGLLRFEFASMTIEAEACEIEYADEAALGVEGRLAHFGAPHQPPTT